MRNAGIQTTQLLQQQHHPPQSQQQQQSQPQGQPVTAHQLSQHHPQLQTHVYGNHIVGPAGGGRIGDQIRDVWASNLDQEFALVRNLISQYPFVSMVFAKVTRNCEPYHVGHRVPRRCCSADWTV